MQQGTGQSFSQSSVRARSEQVKIITEVVAGNFAKEARSFVMVAENSAVEANSSKQGEAARNFRLAIADSLVIK